MIKGCFLLKTLFLPATVTHRRLRTAKQTVSLIVMSILLVVSVESQYKTCLNLCVLSCPHSRLCVFLCGQCTWKHARQWSSGVNAWTFGCLRSCPHPRLRGWSHTLLLGCSLRCTAPHIHTQTHIFKLTHIHFKKEIRCTYQIILMIGLWWW